MTERTAVAWTNIKVFVDIVITEVNWLIDTRWFGSPDFWRSDNWESWDGRGRGGADDGGVASFIGGRDGRSGVIDRQREQLAAEVLGTRVVHTDDTVWRGCGGIRRVENVLTGGLELRGADVVVQEGLPIEVDVVGKATRTESFEKGKCSVEGSGVGGECPVVDDEAKGGAEW